MPSWFDLLADRKHSNLFECFIEAVNTLNRFDDQRKPDGPRVSRDWCELLRAALWDFSCSRSVLCEALRAAMWGIACSRAGIVSFHVQTGLWEIRASVDVLWIQWVRPGNRCPARISIGLLWAFTCGHHFGVFVSSGLWDRRCASVLDWLWMFYCESLRAYGLWDFASVQL